MAGVILVERPEFTKEPNVVNSLNFSHAPERVLPGRIMIEIVENDRIIGGPTPEAAELNRRLYASFCSGNLLLRDARTAEMAKLTENAYRDVNIAFANELAIIAEPQGIDTWKLIELANHHPRVEVLQPGPGVGGHCIAVDPWFLVSADREYSKLIAIAREVNDSKPQFIINKVLKRAKRFKNPTIATLGIAFKANIGDLRESPCMENAVALLDHINGGSILIVEPNISSLPSEFLERQNVELTGLDEAIERADIVFLLGDHDSYRAVDRNVLRERIVIDTEGILSGKSSLIVFE